MKKCIFLYRQRYLAISYYSYYYGQCDVSSTREYSDKGKVLSQGGYPVYRRNEDYTFFYKDSDLKDKSKKEINCSGTIEEVLKNLFKGSGVN